MWSFATEQERMRKDCPVIFPLSFLKRYSPYGFISHTYAIGLIEDSYPNLHTIVFGVRVIQSVVKEAKIFT